MNGAGPADPTGPNPALMSALTTEHYTLQAARSSTVVEANGRSMLFLSAVSGATVALALVAQLDRMGDTFLTFALTMLPALLALGLTSYSRLADLAVHDAYYARAIGRIRAFYLSIEPAAQHYWLQPAGDDAHAVMRQAGQPHSRWHHLGHTATSVATVVAVITGAFLGLVGSVVTPVSTPILAVGGVVVTLVTFAGLLADQERRWQASDDSLPSHFLPDGTPSMRAGGDERSRGSHWAVPPPSHDPARDTRSRPQRRRDTATSAMLHGSARGSRSPQPRSTSSR